MSVDANIAYAMSKENNVSIELAKLALERSRHDPHKAKSLMMRWQNNPPLSSPPIYGVINSYFDASMGAGAIVKVTCTNEELASTREFYELVSEITSEIASYNHSYAVTTTIEHLEKKHQCNIIIDAHRFEKSSPTSLITTYSHRDNVAVIVETEVDKTEAFSNKAFRIFSLDCAMHIVAFRPLNLLPQDLPIQLIEDTKLKIEKLCLSEGRDMRHWPDIIEGKLKKMTNSSCLLTQIFIKSDLLTVEDNIKTLSNKIGAQVQIKKFALLTLE